MEGHLGEQDYLGVSLCLLAAADAGRCADRGRRWYKTVLTSGAVSLMILNLPFQSHGVRIFGSSVRCWRGDQEC